MRDFAAETLQKNGIKSNLITDTVSNPHLTNISTPKMIVVVTDKNRAFFEQKLHEKIENFRFVAFFTSFLQKNFRFFKSKFLFRFDQFWPRTVHSHVH